MSELATIWELGTGTLLTMLLLAALLRGQPVPWRTANWSFTIAVLWPIAACVGLFAAMSILREVAHASRREP